MEAKSIITCVSVEDHEDGTCTMRFDMDDATVRVFAAIGLRLTLIQAALDKIAEREDREAP